MPAWDEQPASAFQESCCDGGECNTTGTSAQYCGCDQKAGWVCDAHKRTSTRGSFMTYIPPPGWDGTGHSHVETRTTGIGGAPTRATTLPDSAEERKKYPIGTGVLDYFPDALLEVARCSYEGNEQHNPGTALHWDRSKSADEYDAMIRHGMQRGTQDKDGVRHSAKMAWRALAFLQKEIEQEGQ